MESDVTEEGAAPLSSPSPLADTGAGSGPLAADHLDAADDLALDFNPPLTIGTGTIVVDAHGVTETLVGAAEASTIWLNHGGSMEEFSGGPGANLLVSGGYDGTRLIGGTGAAEANTFILNGGIGAGTAAHVEIQNFNPAHDTLLLPAALYAGLGPQPVLAGLDGNVVVMPDQAAAADHDGSAAAVLIVGSGANADLYYYNPHDPYYGDQAHAYQLATIAGVSPTDAAGHILFSNPQVPSTDGTV
jgi:hypothetical protein